MKANEGQADGLTVFNKKRRVRLKEKIFPVLKRYSDLLGLYQQTYLIKGGLKTKRPRKASVASLSFTSRVNQSHFQYLESRVANSSRILTFPAEQIKKKKRQWSPPAQLKESQSFSRRSNRVRPAILSLAWLHYVRSPGRHKGS